MGVKRLGYRLALTPIADDEWRATFSGDAELAAGGYDVAPTPWAAVQMVAWRAIWLPTGLKV